jgi:2-keto-4-pentenoate hydratase/2-oxohepta-3-ene-1,7-dioic acid hydratase in catechol pathway
MRFAAVSIVAVLLATSQTAQSVTFKLGRFSQADRMFLGVVVDDRTVAEIPASPGLSLKALIENYAKARTMLTDLAARARSSKGPGIYDLKALDTHAPIPDPQTMLNAAVNYVEHGNEMARAGGAAPPPPAAAVPAPIPGIWERKPGDTRQNPYLFPKLAAAITGDGDPIRLPAGRDRIDWECELAVVIGRTADHVTPEQAKEHIFGYTLMNDVSDRGGRADGRHGSDWLLGKSHPTFAPLGPFVVPQEFVPDPQKMPIRFTLSGKVMQESNTDRMTHTAYELVSYASHIVTLQPGDIIATGSPAGVGTARDTPIYMKAGDVSVCTIGNIGTLTNPVVAAARAAR